jgi:hypothetical protein
MVPLLLLLLPHTTSTVNFWALHSDLVSKGNVLKRMVAFSSRDPRNCAIVLTVDTMTIVVYSFRTFIV